jgi:hypothetical protein
VTDKLENPTDDEQREGPAPVEEKQWKRHDDHGNADAVREFIERMRMFRFVVFNKRFGHGIPPSDQPLFARLVIPGHQ